MKIQIEIGLTKKVPPMILNWATSTFFDDYQIEVDSMYQFLVDNDENCIVDNVNVFLLYALNNCILAFEVKDNPEIKDDNEMYHKIPKLDPAKYKIFEVLENGKRKNIQNENGTININYFNSLMGVVMDDFYISLNYLKSK